MYNIFEGKTHFSALVSAAENGETIIITRKGKPVAQIVPLTRAPKRSAREALDRILARDIRIGIPVRELIDEGRRR
ncbi:MAG: type II toxin-antitoxin system prevent-host-death family antitoxin [Candidatus Baltobacteraceae bacterium]